MTMRRNRLRAEPMNVGPWRHAVLKLASGADGPVNALAQEVRVPIVAAVFEQHVDHDHPQGDLLLPPGLIPG